MSKLKEAYLFLVLLADPVGCDGFGALEWQTKDAVNAELSQGTIGARHAEENGVEVVLDKTVVGKEAARVGVDIGPGVLSLAVLLQDTGHYFVDSRHKLEQLIVGHMFEGELALCRVARVGLAQHGVAESGDHISCSARQGRLLNVSKLDRACVREYGGIPNSTHVEKMGSRTQQNYVR